MRIELTIEVLQTSALPLGYRATRHAKRKSPRGRSHSTAELLPLEPFEYKRVGGAEQTGTGFRLLALGFRVYALRDVAWNHFGLGLHVQCGLKG